MEIFCAYFDVQGFYIDGVFHPVEICMKTKKEIFHSRVKKDCNCRPSNQENKSMVYLTKNYHGLTLTDDGIHFKKLINV